MTPITVLILVCRIGVPASDCQPETAIDKIVAPVENELQCPLTGQAILAGGGAALAPRQGREYMKIVCKRSSKISEK
jgi:hypothetical protein